MQFKSKWINPEPLLEDESKYDSSIKHRIPLKPRVDAVLKRIDFQISKLEIIANDLKSNDYEIFRNAMSLVKENNSERARVYLSDLMQIRKISKTVVLSKIVFENFKPDGTCWSSAATSCLSARHDLLVSRFCQANSWAGPLQKNFVACRLSLVNCFRAL